MSTTKLAPSKFVQWCYHRHDTFCNQKYDNGRLPYSMHLMYVDAFRKRFDSLLSPYEKGLALMACAGHDLIEDARVSYNDIMVMTDKEVAEIIYLCTEMRGRNRTERHNDEYYKQLRSNEVAVFVKLCDIMANATYSLLTNSRMLDVYREEYPRVVSNLHIMRFDPMFGFIQSTIGI